jgi:nicotinate-nucleotide pyrophosphorylase (carboxylating)
VALAEDIGLGDITTLATVAPAARGAAVMRAKQACVVAGLPVAARVFERVEPGVVFQAQVAEGTRVEPGTVVARLAGPLRGILTGERTALNFVQRLCGVATITRRYVEALEGTGARIVDTRKTTPGHRMLEKYAVVVGGGANHRWSLDSGILIKDNHLAAAGGVRPAVERARAVAPHLLRIEVECKTLDEVHEALAVGAEAILLDNMRGETLARAVDAARGRALVEVSGGITLETVREVALAGVDLISAGALTHSAGSIDISLDLEAT